MRIDGLLSSPGAVTRGIPQGTVLGPMLFSVYTNDLVPCYRDRTTVIKYADDQTWSHTIPFGSLDYISAEIDHVYNWCLQNRMSLNVKKTKEMILHNYQSLPDLPPLVVHDITINRLSSMCILGVTLQDNLK